MKRQLISTATALTILSFGLPLASQAQGSTVDEVTQAIVDFYAYTREHLADPPNSVAEEGALQFWSSGGLVRSVVEDTSAAYESFNVHPKHIQVIPLVEGKAAAAVYYAEGTMHPKGSDPVSHYLTRVLEVYVHEDGDWKVRTAHWSALRGGSGTSQTSE